MKHESTIVLEGVLSVRAAIMGESRAVEEIWIDRRKRDDRAFGELTVLARVRRVEVKYVSGDDIEARLSGKTSGGVIAFVSERRHLAVSELLDRAPYGNWAVLEGFEDPYNYGYAIRALYAAGFDGVITSRGNWNGTDAVYVRASAGASELMPIARIEDYGEAISHIRAAGVLIICAVQSRKSVSLFDARIPAPRALVIGGERRGISKAFLKAADLSLVIPYGRECGFALPGASAVAVIAFEFLRQSYHG